MFIERCFRISVVPSVFTRSFFPFLSLHLLPLLEVRIFFLWTLFWNHKPAILCQNEPPICQGFPRPNSLSLENPRYGFYPHRVLIHLPFNPRSYDLTDLTQLKCCIGSVNINTHLKTCMGFNNQYTGISHPYRSYNIQTGWYGFFTYV